VSEFIHRGGSQKNVAKIASIATILHTFSANIEFQISAAISELVEKSDEADMLIPLGKGAVH